MHYCDNCHTICGEENGLIARIKELEDALADRIRRRAEDVAESSGAIRKLENDLDTAKEQIKCLEIRRAGAVKRGLMILKSKTEIAEELARVTYSAQRLFHEVEQTLGKALRYPWFRDDPANFPGATEADGVCVGEHVPESIALEAANMIKALEERLAGGSVLPYTPHEYDAEDGSRFPPAVKEW